MSEKIKENTFEMVVTVLGVVSVELYFMSPIISIVRYKLGKCEISHIPFIQILCNLVNCASYIVSGLNLDDKQQFYCNLIGVSISAIYTVLLWTFYSQDQKPTDKNKENKTETIIYVFMLFNVVFQAFYFLKKIAPVIQVLSCVMNILMYAAGYIVVYEAYKSKKAEFVPWQGAACGLFSCVMWICYTSSLIYRIGISQFKKYYPSLIANSTGFLVLIGIIGCYFKFQKLFGNGNFKGSDSLLSVGSKQTDQSKYESIQDNEDDDD